MPNGWWKLVITNTESEDEIELNDGDKQHIAEMIKEGYMEGQIIQE